MRQVVAKKLFKLSRKIVTKDYHTEAYARLKKLWYRLNWIERTGFFKWDMLKIRKMM